MPTDRRPGAPRALVLGLISVLCTGTLAVAPTAARADEPASGDTVIGTLVQVYDDPSPHLPSSPGHAGAESDSLLSYIQPASGDALRVPTDDVEDVPLGATVAVTVGETVRDEASADGLEPATDVLATEVVRDPTIDRQTVAAAVAPVNHPVTVVMMLPAGAAPDTTTLADVTAAVNGPVADFWAQQSGGAVRLGVTTGVDWFQGTTTCQQPFALWAEAAAKASWTPKPGTHLLVYLPAGAPDCAYGLGTMGQSLASGGQLYVQSTGTSVLAHELGHNFGLGHSSALQCAGTVEATDSSACQVSTYRDYYDVMGFSWSQIGSLSALHQARLGVLPAGQFADVAPTSSPVEFVLAPVSGTTGLRALRLTAANGSRYWLEYRPAIGRDSWLGTAANAAGVPPGVLVRMENSSGSGDTSILLDLTPSQPTSWAGDYAAVLPAGMPGSVAAGAFTVRLSSSDAAGARVQIAPRPDPIGSVYLATGAANGPLGAATGEQTCGLRDGGCFRSYRNGTIFWSPATGAHALLGLVGQAWAARGSERGPLGYPLTGQFCGLPAGGCGQHFQGGSLYWSPATGTRRVTGLIGQTWAARGWERGPLGYPLTDEFCGLPAGGCGQHFQGGSLYWSPATGARPVSGAIRDAWAARGWERGALGYPTADPGCARSGSCSQSFQRGVITWTPRAGRPALTTVRITQG
ncbi:MAG TPA: zinc-dependent metalloprotease family protein [Blastococcus sp.]